MLRQHLGAFSLQLLTLAAMAASPAAAETHQVTTVGNRFSPANLTIKAGDTVTWSNGGGIHNVETDPGQIEMFRCANGCDATGGNGDASSASWSFSLVFNNVGTIGYNCEVHVASGMRGTIVVEAAEPEPDPEPGSLQFTRNSFSAGESQSDVTIAVSRTGGSDGAVSADYATSDGSATAGEDYVATQGTLNWGDGDMANKSFDVPLFDDSDVEGQETFDVNLSNPTGGATLGTARRAGVNIGDDDNFTPMDCTPSDTTACLNNDRFRVAVEWQRPPRFPLGPAFVSDLRTEDSALFYYLKNDPDNLELLIKVLDRCGSSDHFWVFFAATTDVEFTVTVVDTETGATNEYFNELGQAAAAVTDTTAFATCP